MCVVLITVAHSLSTEILLDFLPLGELLTVAPWAAKKMPGLFALNERVILLGEWEHGFFAYGAVGAYNVGSINLPLDKVNRTTSLYCFAVVG